MRLFVIWIFAAGCAIVFAGSASAVRIMTDPGAQPGMPALQFNNIAITPDGTKIIATGLFNEALTVDRVYGLTIPIDPANQIASLPQLSSGSFAIGINPNYDVAFPPVISPNGQTILYTHNNGGTSNTIYKMPIAGEYNATSFTGLFGAAPNLVSPGNGNANPLYSPNGSAIFFLNSEAGFNGAIPNFESPSSPIAFAPGSDWDVLYSVPAAGGTPVAITLPDHGDIDVGLFAVTPNGASIIYAPDNPVIERKDRDGIRPKLYSIPATGGSPTEISVPAPSHEFSITNQLSITPDGSRVLFIGDYETLGKNELFSVPIGGGTPMRVSDDLPFAGDVYSFAIAPNGTSVAYAAGQNNSSNTELFLKAVNGGAGSSIRVSDPIASNTGLLDVSTGSDGGQIVFSPDSTKIYFLGDLDTDDVNDLYVVDTTEKAGFVPKPFTYVGADGGDFFNEMNWQDADGNNPPTDTINPSVPIRQSLIIDGKSVVATTAPGGEVQFQLGGSLELTPGSMLSSPQAQLLFQPGSGLKSTDATISFREDVILSGTNVLDGGLIESFADDVEFQDNHKSLINGTTFRSTQGIVLFDNSATSITGATFESADRLSLRYEVDVTVVDTTIVVGVGGTSDVEDAFTGAQGEGSTLTLKGASTLRADTIEDGVSLVLDGTSVATLLAGSGDDALVDAPGKIAFASTGAELITLRPSFADVRTLIINWLTGMSYFDDPSAWNVTNWNGIDALASLKLVSVGLAGDYNDDGMVDAADYTVWRDHLGELDETNLNNNGDGGAVSQSDYTWWKQHFGDSSSGSGGVSNAVPEPAAWVLLAISAGTCGSLRRRTAKNRVAAVSQGIRFKECIHVPAKA
jgi:Tol biopolymer transport system component